EQTQQGESPHTDALRTMSMATTSGRAVYALPDIVDAATGVACMDNWGATTTANVPDARIDHTVVWTGSEMIVWGGLFYANGWQYLNTGSKYNPSTDTWTTTSTTDAPTSRENHTAVWTGSEMIVWGGDSYDGSNGHFWNTGGKYNPA